MCAVGLLTLVVAVSIVGASLRGFDPTLGIIDQKLFADEINAAQNTWVAGDNFGRPLSMRELKRYGSTILKKPDLPMKAYGSSDQKNLLAIPASFDLRREYPQCVSISSVKDQSNCGSCWAVTSAAALSDRFCIRTNGSIQVNISAESLISCCGSCGYGCNGGYIDQTWTHFKLMGEVSGGDYNSFDGCQPYEIMPCGGAGEPKCEEEEVETPPCRYYCTNQYYPVQHCYDRRTTRSAYYMARDIFSIQREIMIGGPLVGSFILHSDFLTYKEGVYVHTSGPPVGGHAARIIGWGRENGVDYWLAVNSWGKSWGDDGTFKFRRGINHCGIESSLIGGDV